MTVLLDKEIKQTLDLWARELKWPLWAVVEAAVRAVPVDEHGLPVSLGMTAPATLFEATEGGEAAA
jgi:hypothetical protein